MDRGAPSNFRFGRTSRIKAGRDFNRLRKNGSRLIHGCLIANWDKLQGGYNSRVGIITTAKLGGAVVRNRARRLLRESFRLHQSDLECAIDLVLVARQSIVGKTFEQVERDFLTTLRKAGLLKVAPGPKA